MCEKCLNGFVRPRWHFPERKGIPMKGSLGRRKRGQLRRLETAADRGEVSFLKKILAQPWGKDFFRSLGFRRKV